MKVDAKNGVETLDQAAPLLIGDDVADATFAQQLEAVRAQIETTTDTSPASSCNMGWGWGN